MIRAMYLRTLKKLLYDKGIWAVYTEGGNGSINISGLHDLVSIHWKDNPKW